MGLDEVHAKKKYGKQPTKCSMRIEVIVQLNRGRVFRFCTFSKNFPLAAQSRPAVMGHFNRACKTYALITLSKWVGSPMRYGSVLLKEHLLLVICVFTKFIQKIITYLLHTNFFVLSGDIMILFTVQIIRKQIANIYRNSFFYDKCWNLNMITNYSS